MSNPPPSTLRTLLGGTCDANGNLTLRSIVPSRSFYSVFTAILKVTSGAPQWELDLLGVPVGIGGGGAVVMGAVYSNPGDSFTLVVTGAAPSAVVSGGLYGFLSDQPENLPRLGISGSSGGPSGALPGGQLLARGSLLNNQDVLAVACGSSSYVAFSLVSGAAIAAGSTINVEGTPDDQHWIGIPWYGESGLTPFSTWTTTQIAGPIGTAQPTIIVATAAFSQVRIRLSPANQGASSMGWVARAVPGASLSDSFGQNVMANSQPVVIASDQAAFPVTANVVNPTQSTYAFRASGLSTGALGAGGAKVMFSLWHLSTSTKTLRLRRLKLYPDSVSAASILLLELLYFGATTLPSGGTAIVPTAMVPGTAAAEASLQSLPATAGATETAVALAIAKINYGIIAGSVSDLFRDGFDLYKHYLPDVQPPTLRAGSQEGFNFKITSSGAATIQFSLVAEFTEA